MRPQIRQKQTSYPLQSSKFTGQVTRKDQKKKQTIRKPTDYFDADDTDYMDSYYEDYDFTSDNEKSAYKPPKRQSHTYYPNLKGVSDPLGLLPSASDPGGFFESKGSFEGSQLWKAELFCNFSRLLFTISTKQTLWRTRSFLLQ
ncbi:uncharacterized protein CEXT_800471 [Caerostris extrusa]|uniref:Uncharacterized protein n=1 Tax=Caerostris extrusa TaxID=172846 RepID=A0AAV4MBS5_CAEEX|nr:uncharacterized protein CEXT_800471 [Caerostris extrusa]